MTRFEVFSDKMPSVRRSNGRPLERDQLRHAARIVCSKIDTVEEARRLLDMLGIDPRDIGASPHEDVTVPEVVAAEGIPE